jgi:hypothetical protein
VENDTVAILPLLSYRALGWFRGFESMIPGVYGGPIAERPLSVAEVDAILDRTADLTAAQLRVFGNPYLDAFVVPRDEAHESTHVIDLRDGFEAVFARFHTNHRRTYRAARERGLTVDRARTIDDFRAYFEIYRKDRARWGDDARTDDPFSLFEIIHRREDPNMVLWLARLEGRIVAGDLWLYWNRHNVGWHGAADPAYFSFHPTNFLVTEIIRDACARGDRWCDLNPSAGLEGVSAFKDAFGAERRYFRHARRPGGRLYRITRRLRKYCLTR